MKFSAPTLLLCATALAAPAVAQQVPIVLPGAPGQPSQTISAAQASKIVGNRFIPADVDFLQAMIPHHRQALDMSKLVAARTNSKEANAAATRILKSQGDEIRFMENWLRQRGQPLAMDHAMHAGMTMGDHADMQGMASPADMARLAGLKGADFERLFYTLMIKHHEGALAMIDGLLKLPGAAYDPTLYEFISDARTDQKAEIERMEGLFARVSPDPRAGLKAGFRDAGQAISNMTLLASLPKPPGFFDPTNPEAKPLPLPVKKGEKPAKEEQFSDRYPLLSFAQTDMAFDRNLLVTGNYHGFNIYRLDTAGMPSLVSSTICPGGQGDVSIVGNLLIMSVEQGRGRVDCGLQGVDRQVSPERFRGIRIFDIADVTRPRQVGQVQTCRGSHTHSVVDSNGRRIVVYVSGTAGVRDGRELAGCVGNVAGDPRTALFSIDVVEIPVADPSKARIVSSPRVFADPKSGNIAGLWRGGDHGEGTQDTAQTDQCHDITVFPTRKIAAGACSGNGIILDIADPMKPKRIDDVSDPGFAYWHSATFNNDGTKVLFTDEWGGGGMPRCRATDPSNFGADAFYDIEGKKLVRKGTFKLPAPQTEQENCVAHNGSAVPVPGRDLFVQAWYQGGISLIDFTDSNRPREIGYFDRGPLDEKHEALGGFWSAYYYKGRIYGTEIARGLDVLSLKPSPQLSANEIAAAALATSEGPFNPQQQYPMRWPDVPVVARAYIDQLVRANAIDAATRTSLVGALARADARLAANAKDGALAGELNALAGRIGNGERQASLAATLKGIAAKLR